MTTPDPVAETAQTDASPDIAAARRVLDLEAAAVTSLSHALDGSLGAALLATVDRLQDLSGRVIVTGMGKSGHVARKIAATLASTGTPALFVHPGEASHGDLGMITTSDVVLALSNSGNTAELSDIVAYARRYGIPLIGLTTGASSTLAETADIALVIPKAPEACPMGLAPTTSTTMMLALGDALAVTLIDRRGFSSSDFQVLHPGGSLGRRLLKVSDLMHGGEAMPLVSEKTRMADALIEITRRSFGCVGVVSEHGGLVGIVTDGDLRRHMSGDLLERDAGEVMTTKPLTIRPQALAAEALGLMNERKVTSLFVCEDPGGRPLGILHIHDCLRAGVA